MSQAPRVSVVIATRNRVELLGEAIRSVLRQTFREFEVIVCDDGSTDGTEALARSFGPPVRYLKLEHTGRPGAPRNRGVEAARGELVAFLDDDDLWEPEKLAMQLALLEREPTLGLVYTGRQVLLPDGSRSEPVLPSSGKRPTGLLDLALSARFPHVCTVLIRRDLLRRVGGFDESMATAEDLDLMLRLARVARAGCVREPLAVVRRRSGTLSERSGALAFRNAVNVLEAQLRANDLTFAQRLRCRATLSRLNEGLAARLAEEGDGAAAHRESLRALRYGPLRPSAWVGAVRAWLAPRGGAGGPRR